MRIETCGGIASGKTTFAELMTDNGIKTILEDFSKNPFWELFYLNPGKYIFETEVTFTLQHYHEIKNAKEKYSKFICDFSSIIDLAYAKIGLEGNKLNIFESIYEEVISDLGQPYLIIYLRCNAKEQLRRIKERNRSTERLITVEFLHKLNVSIENLLSTLDSSTKIITFDSEKSNFITNNNEKKKLVNLIMEKINH